MPEVDPARIAAIRQFNRFYTKQIGTLEEGLLHTRFSLTEARILYEIASREDATATEIASDLSLDMGYLSRILRDFAKGGIIHRRPSPSDRRQSLLSLTPKGRNHFRKLNTRSNEQVNELLSPLSASAQQQLITAMSSIQSLLAPTATPTTPYLLRAHRPGDIGWIIERTALSTRRSTDGTQRLKHWSLASPQTSSTTTPPRMKPAGSPTVTASGSAPSCWCANATRRFLQRVFAC